MSSVVVADAGPPHYLALIGAIDLLPRLFGKVLIPDIVHAELSRTRTPAPVRAWVATSPHWLEIRSGLNTGSPRLAGRGAGEGAVIALAHVLGAKLVLMDDRAGVRVARSEGLEVTGTLGILSRAAALGLVDLQVAITLLEATNFRCRAALLKQVLARHTGLVRETKLP